MNRSRSVFKHRCWTTRMRNHITMKMEWVVIQVSTWNVFVDFNPTYTREEVLFKIKVLEVKRN